ncbi:MAG: carbon-nitrogen hydrolase family protein [Proteobacteria bacterium]|nr:carbon-nitrogen hydrolase family protein [Pseudomonadota bacterium]MBU1451820.1 carbon-nitrogen hydrolase family protein [Pseudomonadota bacterium]
MPKQTYKVAAMIAASSHKSKDETMDKVLAMTREAAARGAQLVVFPETFVPYYPWWIWMAVNNTQRLNLYRQLYHNSIEVPGPEIQRLAEEAARLKIHVTLGINERDGGTIYNSQVLIDDQGRLVGKRRKLMPTGEEKTIWGWGHGNDLVVYDTSLGKIGPLICYEHSMALSRFALYAMGEQVHVANWPGANFKSQPRNRSRIIDAAMRHTAFEGQVFVIFSSSMLTEEDVAYYHELDPSTEESLEPGGGIAGIIDPLGNYVAGPVEHEETMLVAEINLELITYAKHMVDSVGHYNRPDVFSLRVDRRPRPAMTSREDIQDPVGQKPVEMVTEMPETI